MVPAVGAAPRHRRHPNRRLSEDSYSAGTYTFEVTNTGAMPHNFAVERDGQRVAGTDILQPGATATVEATLEEGNYFFHCEVGRHRANGMEVPVTVSGARAGAAGSASQCRPVVVSAG